MTGRLARRLGPFDATAIGLGSMLGAGVFAVFAPAAPSAGAGRVQGAAGRRAHRRRPPETWPWPAIGTCRPLWPPGTHASTSRTGPSWPWPCSSAASCPWPRWINVLGLAGCLLLAATLPVTSVLIGLAVFAVGLAARAVIRR